MQKYAIYLIIISILAIAGVLLYYPFDQHSASTLRPKVSASSTAADSRTEPLSPSAKESEAKLAQPVDAPSRANVEKNPASEKLLAPEMAVALEFQRARDLKAFYEKYRNNPSPGFKFWVANALEICVRFAKNPQGKTYESADNFYQWSAEGKELADRTEAFKILQSRCNGLETRPVKETLRELGALKEAAVQQGDVKARASLGVLIDDKYSDADIAKTVGGVLKAQDPYAIAEMASLLQRPGLDYMLLGLGNQPISYEVVDAAARMVACDLGADCTRDSVSWVSACIDQNRCAAPNVSKQILDNLDSDADRNEVQRVRQLILKAVQTGDVSLLGLPSQ